MKYHSMKERWGFIDGVYMFMYTHVIYKSGNSYFSARVPARFASPAALPEIEPCLLQEIDGKDLWPAMEPQLTVCDDPKRHGLHVKRPCIANYDGTPLLREYFILEARICQILTKHPHPNIIYFRGCTVGRNREITGLCFDRYTETLGDRFRSGFPVDTEKCIAQIRAGVAHLHMLNLVHNDITPENIMFMGTEQSLVIIDYDSCAIRGFGLPANHGPAIHGATTAEFENDFIGIRLLYDRLLEHERKLKGQR